MGILEGVRDQCIEKDFPVRLLRKREEQNDARFIAWNPWPPDPRNEVWSVAGEASRVPEGGFLQLPNRPLTKGQGWWRQFTAESSFCEVERDRDRKGRFPSLNPDKPRLKCKWNASWKDCATLYLVSRQLSYYGIFCFLYLTGADPFLVSRNSWHKLVIEINSWICEIKINHRHCLLWLRW